MSACMNVIQTDIKRETMAMAFDDLRTQILLLEQQNENFRLKISEETKKNVEMTRLLQQRRPFKRTATGELIFPGKKEMKFKLDIMTNEIFKLRRALDDFQRDRCKIDLTKELLKSVKCSESKKNTEDLEKSQLIRDLDEKFNKMKDRFDEHILEISKYRVKLDEVKNELDANEKKLQETQINFNESNLKLTQIELNITNESDKKDGLDLKNEHDFVDNRLNGLKSMIESQMNELNAQNKKYMDAIHEKEYQSIRNGNLCKEKIRLTTEFETEFNRVKKYCKKQLEHLEYLPFALQTVQDQLVAQQELKTSVEKKVEILSRKLKTINEDPCLDSEINSRQLMKLKDQSSSLKLERENMEKVLANIKHCYEVTKQKTNEQNSRLNEIKINTEMKINELQNIFKRPTEGYLCIIDKLQNKIAKIKAHSCFEDGKQKLVSFVMQEQIDELTNIMRDVQEQITEIEHLQKYLSFTQTKICNVQT